MPIGIRVSGPQGGAPFYTNTEAGYARDLNHLSLIRPGQTVDWVNDQITGGKAARVTAFVGRGVTVSNPPPDIKLANMRWWNDPYTGWAYKGRAIATSPIPQLRVMVYAVVRRGGKVVAAGRSGIERVARGAKPPLVSVYPVGDNPNSGIVSAVAPPVTFK